MPTLKTIGTFAIIVGCFAILYPRFLHPMLLRAFGTYNEPLKEDSAYPPHMRKNGVPPRDKLPPPLPHNPKEVRQHMRPGPHPGLRAAAEMQKQQPQGAGRGMMGIVLPMYAVGICVYLVYTLFKVFSKRGKYEDPSSQPPYQEERNENWALDRLGFPRDMKGDPGEVQKFLQQKRQEEELEDLLLKMDERNVSEGEMQALQKRLEETEAQMTRILQAMQLMQSRMNTVVPSEQPSNTVSDNSIVDKANNTSPSVDTIGTLAEEQIRDFKEETSMKKIFSDLSPETESYEIIKSHGTEASTCSLATEPHSPLEEELKELEDNGSTVQEVVLERPEDDMTSAGLRQRKPDKVEEH